jgi:1-acyl-sn-glycerol-3-phosphate acyltransferase
LTGILEEVVMVPTIHPSLLKWFKRYLRYWYVPWHLHAIRIARSGPCPPVPPGPLIVVSNHPSWWDPLVLMLLTDLLPRRRHFAPMDAAALRQYRFFARLGLFAVEPNTPRGARQFLRTGLAICRCPDTALWVTAQGRFADVRERPVRLQGGVGHLAARLDHGHVLPVALEYTYWEQRFPEALVRFGDLIPIRPQTTAVDWITRLAYELTISLDHMAAESIQQRPALFETYLTGRAGVGGAYDTWRRMRAVTRREPFSAAHAVSRRRLA